jgi:phosphoenolpyruvate-protein kinase (PTS system EI component)
MIETPEAAAEAGSIAAEADFVCVGTNDLASLVLGVERTDACQAIHPRVLAAIVQIVEATHHAGKKVTVCGEVAADPLGARVLVGLGVDALSVAPSRLAGAVDALGGTTREECCALARTALEGDENS